MSDGTGRQKSTARWKMYSCEDTDERARISVRRAIVLVATARG